MKYIIFLLIVIVLAFAMSSAVGQQRGVTCYNTKSLGPYDDDDLPVLGDEYRCCDDSLLGKLKFDVSTQTGWCRIVGEIKGSTVTYLMAFSEDYDDGVDSVYERGTSGELTKDTLNIEIATGSTTGHFSDILLSAAYYK